MNTGKNDLGDATVTHVFYSNRRFERAWRSIGTFSVCRSYSLLLPDGILQCGASVARGCYSGRQKVQRGSQIYFGVKDIQSVYSSLAHRRRFKGATARRESISLIGKCGSQSLLIQTASARANERSNRSSDV